MFNLYKLTHPADDRRIDRVNIVFLLLQGLSSAVIMFIQLELVFNFWSVDQLLVKTGL